jgi:hypothetical protein
MNHILKSPNLPYMPYCSIAIHIQNHLCFLSRDAHSLVQMQIGGSDNLSINATNELVTFPLSISSSIYCVACPNLC